MAWKELYPSLVYLKDCQHLWVTTGDRLYSFTELTKFFKIPFYAIKNSKIVIFTKVENGGITTRIVDSLGNIEAEQYVEGEGVATTLQIEVEVTNTTGGLRYLEVEGIPDGGVTETIYGLTVLQVITGGGWKKVEPTAGAGWKFLSYE